MPPVAPLMPLGRPTCANGGGHGADDLAPTVLKQRQTTSRHRLLQYAFYCRHAPSRQLPTACRPSWPPTTACRPLTADVTPPSAARLLPVSHHSSQAVASGPGRRTVVLAATYWCPATNPPTADPGNLPPPAFVLPVLANCLLTIAIRWSHTFGRRLLVFAAKRLADDDRLPATIRRLKAAC